MIRRNNNYEKNPLRMVIYILAVILLVGCILYLLQYSGMKKEEYREEVKRVSALEASAQAEKEKKESSEKKTEDVSVTPAPKEKDKVSEPTPTPEEAESDLTPTAEAEKPEPTPTAEAEKSDLTPTAEAKKPEPTPTAEAKKIEPTPTPEVEKPEPTPTPEQKKQGDAAVNAEEAVKEKSILVLNGTRRPGVAAFWKTEMEKYGYKNIMPVTYTKVVEYETVILTEDVELAQPLLEVFPYAKIQEGSVQEGIELEPGVTLPKKIDIYIIIGERDVRM